MKKMKAHTITALDIEFVGLSEAIEYLKELEKEYMKAGYTNLYIDLGYYYSEDNKESLLLTGEKPETDIEEANRMAHEEKYNKENQQRELQQLELLKKKYENK